MGSSDQRQSSRVGINAEGHHNDFFVESSGQNHKISNIRDVSISGVGLELQQAHNKGDQVNLKYDSDDLQLSINGTVMWCESQADGHCAMGIQFDTDNGENNTLFFLAMRKYLDDFDSLPIDA